MVRHRRHDRDIACDFGTTSKTITPTPSPSSGQSPRAKSTLTAGPVVFFSGCHFGSLGNQPCKRYCGASRSLPRQVSPSDEFAKGKGKQDPKTHAPRRLARLRSSALHFSIGLSTSWSGRRARRLPSISVLSPAGQNVCRPCGYVLSIGSRRRIAVSLKPSRSRRRTSFNTTAPP